MGVRGKVLISTLGSAAVIRQELLEGEPLELLFKEFDEEPLGSASIAQVHRSVWLALLGLYGGRGSPIETE